MNKYTKVLIEDQTGIVIINRPEVYGALNKEAKKEVEDAINEFSHNSSIKSIILTSEGKAFCSGQDLNDRSVQTNEQKNDLGKTLETEWNPLVLSIKNSHKPVICALNGVAAGAGLSVALACDFIIAKPATKLVCGFTQLGLIPDAGITFTLTKALGYHHAMNFFLTNRPLLTDELFAKNIIFQITDNVLEESKKLAIKLNMLAPISVKNIKENLKNSQEKSYNEIMEREILSQRECGFSDDYQEGIKAFFEKRSPVFQGK